MSDPYSEIEAKFDADDLPISTVQSLVDSLGEGKMPWKAECYRHVQGTDTFFKVNEKIVRVRNDRLIDQVTYNNYAAAPASMTCLTVKERRSQANLYNRKEVDLYVGPQNPEDVIAFFEMMGGYVYFSITKEYHIWVLEQDGIKVCLAMYDVARLDGSDKRRFLELEIEKDSACDVDEAMGCLRYWIGLLKQRLLMNDPINTSLSEMYAP